MWTCGKRFHIKWNLKFKSKTIKHNPACASNSFQCGISIKPLCVDVSRWCIGMNCEPLMMCSYIMASALHVYAAHESLNTCLQETHWVNLSRLNTYNFTRQLAAHWPHRWFPLVDGGLTPRRCLRSYLWEFVPQVISRRVPIHVRHQVILQIDRDGDQYWKRNKLDLDRNGELGKRNKPKQ